MYRLSTWVVIGLMLIAGSSCNNDDGGTTFPPDIEDLPFQISIENLATYNVTITLIAEGKAEELNITKDGVSYGDAIPLEGEKELTYDFTYTATAEDSNSNIIFEFTLTDQERRTKTETLILSIGDAPATEG